MVGIVLVCFDCVNRGWVIFAVGGGHHGCVWGGVQV